MRYPLYYQLKEKRERILMNKRYLFLFTFLFIAANAAYLAYDAKQILPDFQQYMQAYLNKPQHYLFVGSFYAISILWATHIPFLDPCFYLRMPKMIECINKRNIGYSCLFGCYTFFSYALTALIAGYPFVWSYTYCFMLAELILFYFMCFELFTALYLRFQKTILSIISVFLINYTGIIFYVEVDFNIFYNGLSESVYHGAFYIYLLAITIICLFFNEFYSKRKELL